MELSDAPIPKMNLCKSYIGMKPVLEVGKLIIILADRVNGTVAQLRDPKVTT